MRLSFAQSRQKSESEHGTSHIGAGEDLNSILELWMKVQRSRWDNETRVEYSVTNFFEET